MSLTWVICGGGRGVGKTHLAQALCRVLPRSLYAKLGHGPARPGRPANYFTSAEGLEGFVASRGGSHENVVVEANAWAREGRGDLILYLDGAPARTAPREDRDVLRGRAHIRIGPGGSALEWGRVLRRHIPDPGLRRGVLEVLEAQARRLDQRLDQDGPA
jgi:hypothetical protein